jgi:hypothetical protein
MNKSHEVKPEKMVELAIFDSGSDERGPVATRDYGTNYAVWDFDQTNTASASFIYALPFGPGEALLYGDSTF